MFPMLTGQYVEDRGAELRREALAARRHGLPVEPPVASRALAARQAVGLALVHLGLRVLVRPPEPLARRA